jgi:hypothetical protein
MCFVLRISYYVFRIVYFVLCIVCRTLHNFYLRFNFLHLNFSFHN